MKNLEWCGLHWKTEMEGHRIIHPDQPWMWYDGDQVLPSNDGTLSLYVEHSPARIKHWDGKVYEPELACGIIRSEERFIYGDASAEVKLPKGRNLWPSFWLTGAESWPPEIDILEAWSNSNGSYFRMTIPQPPYLVPSWKTTNNVHFINDMEVKDAAGSRSVPIWKQAKDPAENFIRYSVEWRPDKIVFRVGNKVVRTVKDDISIHIARKPMNIIFNIWTTGTDYSLTQPMLIRNFKYTPLVTN